MFGMIASSNKQLKGQAEMRFQSTNIEGVWLVRVGWHTDPRGRFGRLFCRDAFAERNLVDNFVQVSLSVTHQSGTVRGMHLQRPPYAETKLVSCMRGMIYDVVVDLRPDSPSYLQWQAFELDQGDGFALYIPKGCAHGFQTLVDDCEVLYQIDTPYAPDYADGVRYDDPVLNIFWPKDISLLSDKDLSWPPMVEKR